MMEKDLMLSMLRRPVAFYPALARVAGGATAGLMLSQLCYWQGKGVHKDGWIYKTADEWERETCLTKAEQRSARAALRARGLIKESDVRTLKIDKFSSTVCYLLDIDQLCEQLAAAARGDGWTEENDQQACA